MPFIGIDQLTEISDQNNKKTISIAHLRKQLETRMREAAQKGEYQATFSVLPFSEECLMIVRKKLFDGGYITYYNPAESSLQVTWG